MTVDPLVEYKLPSEELYVKLNQEYVDSDIYSHRCETLKSQLNDIPKINNLCRKIERNVNDVCFVEKKDDFLKFSCEYVQYWLINELYDISKSEMHLYKGRISRFCAIWHALTGTLDYAKKCVAQKNLFYALIPSNIKYKKEMYDYFYNYKYFEKNKFSNKNECNQICKYLSTMVSKFPEFKSWCSDTSNNCSIDMKSLEQCKPQNLIELLGCDNNGICTKLSDGENAQGNPKEYRSPEMAQSDDALHDELVTEEQGLKASTTAVTMSLSLLGLFSICFIIIKLTPVRSWLYNRISKQGKITEHLHEEGSEELFDDYFISENIKPHGKGYSVAYHSLQNIG